MRADARHDVPGRERHAGSAAVFTFAAVVLTIGSVMSGCPEVRAREPARFTDARIEQLAAPVALYPDALLAQVLMAATFPDQIAAADRWLQANSRVPLPELDDALSTASWDPSVISLCKFPPLIDNMAGDIPWTTDLGSAFLEQRPAVFDAVQKLRREAYETGHLRSNSEQTITVTSYGIEILPFDPDVVYVPTYDPAVVYGSAWSYPAYYYFAAWAPSPGETFVKGFAWGPGWYAGGALFGGVDWTTRTVFVEKTAIAQGVMFRSTEYYHHRDSYAAGRHAWVRVTSTARPADEARRAPYGGRDHGFIRGVPAPPSFRVAQHDSSVIPLPPLEWHGYRPDAVFIPPVEFGETPAPDQPDYDTTVVGDVGWGYPAYGPSCADGRAWVPRRGRAGRDMPPEGGPRRHPEPPPPSPPPPRPPPHPRPGPGPGHEGTGHIEKDGGPQRRTNDADRASPTADRRTRTAG